MKRIAVIQIRGGIGMKRQVLTTLNNLKLFKKNSCSIISNSPSYIGMLTLVKDFVTWGEIDNETFKSLLIKRGKLPGNKAIDEAYLKDKLNMDVNKFSEEFINFKKELKDIPGLKQFFRLTPPVKGFERGGIKRPYSMGGVLGYRKEVINDLIRRML